MIRKLCYELYKVDWKHSHMITKEREMDSIKNYYEDLVDDDTEYTYNDYLEEFGYDGELYACYEEFLEVEYLEKGYICSLLNNEELIAMYYKDIEVADDVKNKVFKWWCRDMNHIRKTLNSEVTDPAVIDVMAVLEYPFVDIELEIDYYDEDTNEIGYCYFCCVNETGRKEDWEDCGYIEFGEIDPKEFTTEEELMEDMKEQLIKFCKENNLRMW